MNSNYEVIFYLNVAVNGEEEEPTSESVIFQSQPRLKRDS